MICFLGFIVRFLLILLVLVIVSVQWKRLPTCNEPPLARAYHSMTCIGSRYLLFGGFDGKSTFGDMWWLVTEGIRFFFSSEFGFSNFSVIIIFGGMHDVIFLFAECYIIKSLYTQLFSCQWPNSQWRQVI